MHVHVGDYLNPGAPVATIADFSRVRVIAGVTAAEAAFLSVEAPARMTFEALGGQELAGRVHSIGRIADPASGTYPVEVWLSGSAAERLREGMIANVSLPLPAEERQLVVPRSALFRETGGLFVYAVQDGKAQMRPVRIGRSNDSLTEVLEGIDAGDRIVTEGLFALRDGASVLVSD